MTARHSLLEQLRCPRCGSTADPSHPQNLCACGSPLLAEYDLGRLGRVLGPTDLARRPHELWRYHELLPVQTPTAEVRLGEPITPLLGLPTLGADLDLPRLSIKDEGPLPTGTFKARGAAIGVSRAVELGIKRIAMPTNGNAGAAWAAYAAQAGLDCLIVMPEDAPDITRRECAVMGAQVLLVNGRIDDAGAIVRRAVAETDAFDVSTLKEPYRLEGKKTLGLEIFEQLGWRCPDVVVYPTGGGVGLLGIWKAAKELRELGWLTGPLPKMVAVQASGCAPIVRAFEAGAATSDAWVGARTIAFGITVPKPIGDALILDVIRESGGCALAVDDDEILSAQALAARRQGRFMCPEGAATVAAARALRASGWLDRDAEVLLINTGTGIKYPGTVTLDLPTLEPGQAVVWPNRRNRA